MSIRWKFWKDTGRTFFRVRISFVIDSDALEFAVSRSYRSINSKSDVIEAVKKEIKETGSPDFWSFDDDFLDEEEVNKKKLKARKITEKYFPEAYKQPGNTAEHARASSW